MKGNPHSFIYKNIRKDKIEFDADVNLFAIKIKSAFYIQTIVRNTTRKKKAKNQIVIFANAFRNISECMIICDTQEYIIFIKEAFTKIYDNKI